MAELHSPDALAEQALKILNEGDPRDARKLLFEAVKAAPDRPDLLHALGVVQLQLGEAELGLRLIQQAIERAEALLSQPDRRQQAETMLEGFFLSLAAACEDMAMVPEATAAYKRVMQMNPGQPRAQSGYAQLLFSSGDLDGGQRELQAYIDADRDEEPFIEGAEALLESVRTFLRRDIHPREFLKAHQAEYTAFFTHHADEQAKLGWIAEAARMKRNDAGHVVPSIPDGARPYAAVRVDLVDPQTGQMGQVGDQPMVVALPDYQALARATIQFQWREQAFDVRVSSQSPWDQLPIQFLLRSGGKAALDALDSLIGDWYMAGFEGAFGKQDSGRFHYISDPEYRSDLRAVVYHVDMGRANLTSIDDLLRRLSVFHAQNPIERLVFGRGYLP